jgi:hypothetical protein
LTPASNTSTAIIEKAAKIDSLSDLDATDSEIILLVIKGRGSASAYAVWTSMKKEAREKNLDRKVMTYRNINKRVVKLAKLGLIEEIKPDIQTINIHGRKDYRITVRGLESLIPHIMAYPKDVKTIIEHMDKFGLDKKVIGDLLSDRIHSTVESVNQFLRFMELPEIEAIYSRKRAAEMRLLQQEVEVLREAFRYSKDEFKKIDQTLNPEPESKRSPAIEAQYAAERAAGLDPDKEITKTLDRVGKASRKKKPT